MPNFIRPLKIALLVALVCLPMALPGAETIPPPLQPDLTTLAAVTPAQFPDADYVIVDNAILTRYGADGTGVTYDDTVFKVLSEKGRREMRTQSFGYNVFYEGLEISRALILKPDGTAVPVDVAKNSKEMVDRAMMSANIYDPNDKVVVLALPGLDVGDTVQVITKKTVKRARMADTFCDWQMFESTNPILRIRYEVRGPKDKPLRSVALLGKIGDTVQHTRHDDGDQTVHVWEARNLPQAFPEPGMPAFYTCAQRLLVSTAGSWEEISKWYWDISEPHLKTTPEIEAKVKELIAGAVDDSDKLKRIFRFVSQEIRYMGITLEKDAPGYEPHDVKITFDNRYGVCRDKAALLVTMLRSAGLDAYPVLMMVGPLRDKEVPMPYFNHAITAVRHKDGTYQLMDSTDENTADLLPPYLYHKSYLVAHPQGETLQVSPVAPPENNMLNVATQLEVTDSGEVTGTVSLDFTGINDNAFRGSFAQAKREDIQRYFESVVKGVVAGATLTNLEITPSDMRNTDEPLRIKLFFTAPDFYTVTSHLMPTPWFGSRLAIAPRILGQGTGLEKRRFPLDIRYTCGLRETLSIKLPSIVGEALAFPEDVTVETPALIYSRALKFTRRPNILTGTLELKLREPQVSPDDYPRLKTALKDIEYAGRQSPVFDPMGKEPSSADTQVLSSVYAIELQDARSWKSRYTERKAILTYAGKKDSGELHLDYNPVWETVAVPSAKVTKQDGTVLTVKPEEMNLMDAPWVASAPRYPAGKTLVVSLPGVEEGGEVEYTVERTAKDKPFFSLEKSYFSFDSVGGDTLELRAPQTVPLFIDDTAGAAVTTEADGHVLIRVAEQSYGLTKKESSLPPVSRFAPTLRVSTLTSPGDHAALVREAAVPLCTVTEAIQSQAKVIIHGAKNDTDKLRSIRDFVAKNIRQAGPNFTDLPLSCLTPAEKTLADGYGHEADRSILLASLLRAAGFQPELVLSTSSPAASFYWKPGQPFRSRLFNRLVTRVPLEGRWIYLDTLSLYAELGATNLEGALAVSLETPALFTLEAESRFVEKSESSYALTLAENGDAEITWSYFYHGPAFEEFKRRFTEMTPEERHRYQQQLATGISQAAESTGAFQADISRYPGELKVSVKVPRFAVRSGRYLYFTLPGAVKSVIGAGSDTRTLPFFVSDRVNSSTRWHVTLPKGMAVSATPKEIRWDGPGGLGSVQLTSRAEKDDTGNTVLNLEARTQLAPTIVPADSYRALLDINRRLGRPEQWQVLLSAEVQ